MSRRSLVVGCGLAALLSKQRNRAYRRYDLKHIDGRLMLVRNEIDRAFDLAISEVCGIELEPHGLRISIRGHQGRWPISTVKHIES